MADEPISAKEYVEQTSATKKVKLKSGRVFEIRQIRVRDYMLEATLPIETTQDVRVSNEDRGKKIWEKLTPEQRKGMKKSNDIALVKGVIKPPLTLEHEVGKLNVSNLTDDDYYELLTAVTEFSFGSGEMRPFREEQSTTST